MKQSGSKRKAWLSFGGTIIDGDGAVTTTAGTWYVILKKGASSNLPPEIPVNTPFKSTATGTQITLVTGDQLLQIDFERFCKTQADFNMEQGSIDVGDDCDPGAQIADGITTISGSLSGFFQFDDATEEFNDITDKVFNIFVPVVEDTGGGSYAYHPVDNSRIYLGLCLNGDAGAGHIENWFLTPINITSVGASGGNTDGQTMEISWTKGEGAAVAYKVPRAA
jgi:hypothetical protein